MKTDEISRDRGPVSLSSSYPCYPSSSVPSVVFFPLAPRSASRRGSTSGQQLLDDDAVDVGETEVPPGVAIGQLLMVEAQQVQHRGVKVMDVDLLLHGGEAELVRRAVGLAALHPAAGQPH